MQNQEQKAKDAKKDYKVAKFKVSMHCENCVKKITENVSYEKGVKNLIVSLDNRTVEISYDPAKTDEDTLAAALRKLGYTVEPVAAQTAERE